jgi:hypothetical protein
MKCYVGLLREDCFAAMRSGLAALACNKLDPRDMRVLNGMRVLGMSPPSTMGSISGTVLELRSGSGRSVTLGRPPMFGSLLAIAPHGDFEQAIWATVAGADTVEDGLRIFAELTPELNDKTDASLVSTLLRHSGQLTLAESPTFYRAYAPAIKKLQLLTEETMPLIQEVVFAEEAAVVDLDGMTVDASVIFGATGGPGSKDFSITAMPAKAFCEALQICSSPISKGRASKGGWDLETGLDPSQCEAARLALTRRLAIVQGPPGTGKTFIGVRIVRLLLSLHQSVSVPDTLCERPVLIMTYKNRALDDFLADCCAIWPDGVARLGGVSQPGTLLEHRHIRHLVRNTRRTEEHGKALREVEKAQQAVVRAASGLAAARTFTADLFVAHRSMSALHSLLLNDETLSDDDLAAIKADLQSSTTEGGQRLLDKARQACRVWMPNKAECAKLCRRAAPESSLQTVASTSKSSDEQHERTEERSRYRCFEAVSVRFDANPSGIEGHDVLDLVQPMSSAELHEMLHTVDVWSLSLAERVSSALLSSANLYFCIGIESFVDLSL